MNAMFVKSCCAGVLGYFILEQPVAKMNIPEPSPPVISMNVDPAAPPAKFNAVTFESAVNKKMKDLVKGYAFAVADKDGIRGRAEGGWAQDPADGNIRMTTRIPSCIGSVTKMMSGTALLNLLEAMPGVKLDDPVFSKLPKKWQQEYKNSRVESLTYRQLLQHKSGFRKGSDTGNLDSMATLSKGDFTAPRDYNNSNFSLLRYLITSLAYPDEAATIEQKRAGMSFDDYSVQVNIDYSFPYERYIRKHILEKGLTPITASCRPEPELQGKAAKRYSSPADTKGNFVMSAKEHEEKGNHCAPQGSWFMSAEMLCHFGRTLLYSNNYLTGTTLNMLFDDASSDNRIVWKEFIRHDGFGKETGQSLWPGHNGAQEEYYAILLQLPYDYVGSALVNSPVDKKTVSILYNALMEAFYEAMHTGPLAEIAKHGIPEGKYQDEISMIYNSGYYPVWVDAYDVNGKTFFNIICRYNSKNYDVVVRHDMTKESYQQQYNEWVKQKGYRLEQIDSYNDAGRLKFAAIFLRTKERLQAQPAYHALSPEEHQTLFEKYSGDGFVPVNVSVVSAGGKRFYSAFYEKRNVGGHVLKSFLTQQEYQALFDDMKKKNWEQVYINAYHHDGQTRFSAIWYERSGYQAYAATRKSDSESYQQKWETNTGNGLLTRCVTGYEEGGKHWFAAHWSK